MTLMDSSPKNENSGTIYLPSCHSKPISLSYETFSSMSKLLFVHTVKLKRDQCQTNKKKSFIKSN